MMRLPSWKEEYVESESKGSDSQPSWGMSYARTL